MFFCVGEIKSKSSRRMIQERDKRMLCVSGEGEGGG